jgi:uncharacterized membrane protein
LRRVIGTLITGVLALLPLLLTAYLVAWIADLLHGAVGPGSLVGRLLTSLGFALGASAAIAYLLGLVALLAVFWAIGLLVRTRVLSWLLAQLDAVVQRLPLIGPVYSVAGRFTRLLERKSDPDLHGMIPVWCLFGESGTVAALGLMPSPDIISIEGRSYRAVLLPSAPVPVGGGLLFLPVEWVRPAGFGIDVFTSIYVSMGVAMPKELLAATAPNRTM